VTICVLDEVESGLNSYRIGDVDNYQKLPILKIPTNSVIIEVYSVSGRIKVFIGFRVRALKLGLWLVFGSLVFGKFSVYFCSFR